MYMCNPTAERKEFSIISRDNEGRIKNVQLDAYSCVEVSGDWEIVVESPPVEDVFLQYAEPNLRELGVIEALQALVNA